MPSAFNARRTARKCLPGARRGQRHTIREITPPNGPRQPNWSYTRLPNSFPLEWDLVSELTKTKNPVLPSRKTLGILGGEDRIRTGV